MIKSNEQYFEKDRMKTRKDSSCERSGKQPLDFDEVTKCDELQLNKSVCTETCWTRMTRGHQASLF